MGNMKTVTVNDIARELGLSRNTVSKVLNGKEMPEKTKRLVLEKAKEMNYKQLADKEHKRFKILLLAGKPLTNYYYYVPVLREIENYCYERGDQLFQHVCRDGEDPAAYLKENIGALHFDGIICIEFFNRSMIRSIINIGIPTAFLDGPVGMFGEGNFDIILQDNYSPIQAELTRLVKECGVKSIGFVGDPDHCLSFHERYETVLIVSGLEDLAHQKSMDFLYPDGHGVYHNRYLMVREINSKKLCDAYLCANDFIARQFINALSVAGYSVPGDIKVIGFDYTPDSNAMKPTITSVSVEPESVAEAIILAIRNRILNPHMNKTLCVVHSKLVQKESTQAPPKQK